jgi:hypothetical protein
MESNNPAGPVDQGGDDTIDNDFDGWNGVSVTLAEGENLENLDAGLVTFTEPMECWAYSDFCTINQSGFIEIEATGGVAPYQFVVTGNAPEFPQTSPSGYFDVGVAGTYEVVVTDAAGQECLTQIDVFDSGFYPTIDLYLWEDLNDDGAFDENTDALDFVVEYEIVDASGNLWTNGSTELVLTQINLAVISQGDYYLRVIPPSGYKVADIPNDPNPDFINSNINPDDAPLTTGQSEIFPIFTCDDYVLIAAAIVPE